MGDGVMGDGLSVLDCGWLARAYNGGHLESLATRRPSRRVPALAAAVFLSLATVRVAGSAGAAPQPVRAQPSTSPIVLDGKLDDAAWATAAAAGGFLQRDPDEGAPATESTELRVVFDDHALYVG